MNCPRYSTKCNKTDFLCHLIKLFLKQSIKLKLTCTFLLILGILEFSLGADLYAGEFDSIIKSAAEDYSISEELIYGVIKAESNSNKFAVSRVDARGLMQITRPTWDWICAEYLKVNWSFDKDSFNPEKNIIVGTRFFAWIRDYLNKHVQELNASESDLLLACYNAGPGTVKKYGFRIPPFNETRQYIAKITSDLR